MAIVGIVLEACGGGGSSSDPTPVPPAPPSQPEPKIDVAEEAAVDENSAGAKLVEVSSTNAREVSVDDARFEVDGGRLKLKPGESLDFESDASPLLLTLTAKGDGGTATAQVSVSIRDVNEVPKITVGDARVPSAVPGASAASIEVSDPDAADARLGAEDIALSDNRFEVREDADGTLRLALKAGIELDAEQVDSVGLTLTVTDGGGLAASTEVVVSVSEPNRAPTIRVESLFVPADTPGVLLGMISIEDPDVADAALGVEDISLDDAKFEVRLDEQGVLRLSLKPGVSLQHSETEETLRVALTVTDGAGATATDTAILVIAPLLPLGKEMIGRIDSANDRDWFAVTLKAGQHYRVDLEGRDTDRGTLGDPHLLGIYDGSGNLLTGTSDDDGGVGANGRAVFVPDEDGSYFVAAAGIDGGTGTYTLSLGHYLDDFASSISTSGALQVGASISGEIELASDEDWFAVQLQAGRSYLIDVEGAATDAGDLADPLLRGIYDASGELLVDTANSDGGVGANSRFVYVAQQDGTYYVSASAEFSETGTYTLSLAEYLDDFQANSETDGKVSVGGSIRGEIGEPGDQDWIAVSLVAGKTYAIGIGGADSGRGSLRDPYLHGLYEASGSYLEGTLDDDGGFGLDSLLKFTPDDSGIYFISVGGASGATGTYSVSVQEETADESASDLGALRVGDEQEWFDGYWPASDDLWIGI